MIILDYTSLLLKAMDYQCFCFNHVILRVELSDYFFAGQKKNRSHVVVSIRAINSMTRFAIVLLNLKGVDNVMPCKLLVLDCQ